MKATNGRLGAVHASCVRTRIFQRSNFFRWSPPQSARVVVTMTTVSSSWEEMKVCKISRSHPLSALCCVRTLFLLLASSTHLLHLKLKRRHNRDNVALKDDKKKSKYIIVDNETSALLQLQQGSIRYKFSSPFQDGTMKLMFEKERRTEEEEEEGKDNEN